MAHVVGRVIAIGFAGCGDDDGDRGVAAAVPGVDRISADRGASGEEILIKTRLAVPVDEVLPGSVIGDGCLDARVNPA